jgi:hypothetical protein
MSSTSSQSSWQKFLSDSLNADTQANTDAEQELAARTGANEFQEQIDATIEQAKESAKDAGANLIGIGGIEAIRATKGLYTAGMGLYTRVQQMRDVGKKLMEQRDARTAKINDLKEKKYNEAQAQNDEIDPLTQSPRGGTIDKVQFMKDADEAISRAQTGEVIDKVRGMIAEKVSPLIDQVGDAANNVIDALGSHLDGAIGSLTNTASQAAAFVKNGFGEYADTANKIKADYVSEFNDIKGISPEDLAARVSKGNKVLDRFTAKASADGVEGIDEHVATVRGLLEQGSTQSVAQASAIFKKLKSDTDAVAPLVKVQKTANEIEALKASVGKQKADVINGLEDTRKSSIEAMEVSKTRLAAAQNLPEGAAPFRSAGGSKSEVVGSIQKDIDNQSFQLDQQIGAAHGQLGNIDAAAGDQMAALTDKMSSATDEAVSALSGVEGVTSDVVSRMGSFLSGAANSAGNAISYGARTLGRVATNVGNAATEVGSAIATVGGTATEALGTLMTPIAVYQGALSAENLVKGGDSGNLEGTASDLINVRFGVGGLKAGFQKAQSFVKNVIVGDKAPPAPNAPVEPRVAGETPSANPDVAAAEKGITDLPQTDEAIASAARTSGTAAGEDIAAGLAEGTAETIGEVGIADLASNAIPVVGEIADVALAGFSLYEGIKGFFETPDAAPKAPAPPPDITQSVSFRGQAGVY